LHINNNNIKDLLPAGYDYGLHINNNNIKDLQAAGYDYGLQ
jgi:hypothetical protein